MLIALIHSAEKEKGAGRLEADGLHFMPTVFMEQMNQSYIFHIYFFFILYQKKLKLIIHSQIKLHS